MKKCSVLLTSAALAMCAGCLGPAPKVPKMWLVETKVTAVKSTEEPRYGAVRLVRLTVRAPYDRPALAVLRNDGSIAFDPANSFAATPAAMLKGTALDVITSTGIFPLAVEHASSAATKNSLEIAVTQFALDCRTQGLRTASVAVKVMLLEGHNVVAVAEGDGETLAKDGDYSAAFSTAFTSALVQALKKL